VFAYIPLTVRPWVYYSATDKYCS